MAKMDACKNCFDKEKCDPWIIDTFENPREIKTPDDYEIIDHSVPPEYSTQADKICSKCKHSDQK